VRIVRVSFGVRIVRVSFGVRIVRVSFGVRISGRLVLCYFADHPISKATKSSNGNYQTA